MNNMIFGENVEGVVSDALDRESIQEEIERRLAEEKEFIPYITFSREPGSGGKPIASLVAKKIGFKLYDKQLVNKVSETMKKSSKIISKVDERKRSGMMDVVQNMLNPDYVSDETYFRTICQEMLKIAQKGKCILIGRGANFITPDAYGLQVQVVAPYRVRVARAIEHEHYDFAKAREVIREVSADREGFVRQYFGKDIYAPKYYDITINTTFYSIEAAANLIIDAYKAKFPSVSLKVS